MTTEKINPMRVEQPNAGSLPWSNEGNELLMAFELLIREYGGKDKLANDIECDEIKNPFRKSHMTGNSERWTYEEIQLLRYSISKRIYPVIKGRSRCAIRNKLQLLKIKTSELHK